MQISRKYLHTSRGKDVLKTGGAKDKRKKS
jgi:hypothetical protein